MPRKSNSLPKGTQVPDHIAIILDGNGRWARSKGLPVAKGHEAGAQALQKVIRACRTYGVHTLTVWGFSTENWKRSPKEVHHIFKLVQKTIKTTLQEAIEEDVRFVHVGRKDRLPKPLLKMIQDAEEKTKDNKSYVLNLALDYGGRDEILRAVKQIVEDEIPAKKIDEKLFSSYLDTGDQPYPNPDLFIRTSGELRTSGYLPWQMVYTEFYFEEDHLPDLTEEKVKAAILDYSCRRRRFGAKDKLKHFRFKPEVVAKFEVNWWRLANIPEGTKFTDYAMQHLSEQWGLSTTLARQGAVYMLEALSTGEQGKWRMAKSKLKDFYVLIRDEMKLAFEPEVAASLELKLLQRINDKSDAKLSEDIEDTTKDLVSEVYRISRFQASKAAHLRALATVERRRAQNGGGEEHWVKAEEYLALYYRALKDKVA